MTKEELEAALKKASEEISLKQKELEDSQKESKKNFDDAIKLKADAEKVKSLEDSLKELKDEKTELSNQLDAIQLKLEKKGNYDEPVDKLEKFATENLEAMKKAMSQKVSTDFHVKASFLTTSVTSNSLAQRDPMISPLAHRTLTMYDLFRKIPITPDQNGTYKYFDWDTGTTARAAAAIAEGGTFPESTAKFIEYSIALKKIGDSIPVSEEMLVDGARFAAELRPFLTQNVDLKVDTDLLDGDGSDENIFGLDARATAFTAASAGISDASLYDLIVKVKSSIKQNTGNKYNPNVAIMNSDTQDTLILKKETGNGYVRPPFVQEVGGNFYVNGVMLVINDNVDDDVMYLGDSRYGAIPESSEGYSLTVGEVGSQFLTDMKTLKARKRLNFLLKNSEQAAWRKVADISAALTTIGS